ncbi:hypothetical protein, partial [Microcystis sp. M086S1]|uniref:hypothetical protein n=1 Tax=Microcystis sp. M086S1 TaxID=2771133 RepID=UPI0025834E94
MKTIVRFHLRRGEHYRHWQVKRGSEVRYYCPIAPRIICSLHLQVISHAIAFFLRYSSLRGILIFEISTKFAQRQVDIV